MTRTTERRALPLAALLLLLACAPQRAMAGGSPERRLFAGAAAGWFYPAAAQFRRLYDRPGWPLELQLGWSMKPHVDLLLAARWLQAKGETRLLEELRPGESYPLTLRALTLRLGAGFRVGDGALVPYLAGGVQYASFREKWSGAAIETSGNGYGVFAQGGCCLRLNRVLQLLALLDYSYTPAGVEGEAGTLDLGGFALQLGVRAGIL